MTPNQLEAALRRGGWTKARFARRMRVSRQSVYDWLSGRRRMSPSRDELARRVLAEGPGER